MGKFMMVIGLGAVVFGLIVAGGAGLGRLLVRDEKRYDPRMVRLIMVGLFSFAVMAALIVMFLLSL